MRLVRLTAADGTLLYVEARDLDPTDEEQELSGSPITAAVDDIGKAMGSFIEDLKVTFSKSGAAKCSVEFGCEIAVETGKIVAVIGKGSAKSTLKVTLEWDQNDR
ncbi:CU044_2847 family protein [Herbidospora sp. RD11066]